MIEWVKEALQLPQTENDEEARRAWLIHIILLTMLGAIVFYQTFNTFIRPASERWAHLSLTLPAIISLATVYLLLRRGQVNRAAYLLIISSHLLLTGLIVTLGDVFSPAFNLFILLIFGSGFLLGRWASLWATIYAMILGHALWMFYELDLSVQPPLNSINAEAPLVVPFIGFLVAMVLVNLVMYRLNLAIRLAQKKEQEALAHSQALQYEVGERHLAEDKLRLYNERLETLRELDKAILAAESTSAIAEAVLARIRKLVPLQRASVMVANRGGAEALLLAMYTEEGSTIAVGHPLPYSFSELEPEFASGNARIVQDLGMKSSRSKMEQILFAEGICAYVIIPLMADNHLIGTLNLGLSQPNGFTDACIEVVTEIAASLSIAIRQSSLHKQLQEQADRLTEQVAVRTAELSRQLQWNMALAALEPIISRPGELEQMLSQIVNTVIELFPAGTQAVIVLQNADNEAFVLQAVEIDGENPAGFLTKWQSSSQSQHIMDSQKIVIVPDVRFGSHQLSAWANFLSLKSYIAIPLISHGKSLGVLYVGCATARNYPQEEIDFLHALANRAAVAVTNVRLNEALQTTNEELSRVSQLKDNFLATMSHELRTPLTAILGLTESLHMGVYGNINDRQTASLHDITASGQHLLELINDILDVSKIEAGQLSLHKQWVNVQKIGQSSLRLIEPNAKAKNLEITYSIDSSLTTLWADERRLRQILVNLLSNAVKFTPAGGQIGLEAYGNELTAEAIFSVWDTGVGIDRTGLKRLFTPFVQLDSSLSREYEGTGLGLALVKRLTELHNGQVTVDTLVGQGSRFTVTLPWDKTQSDQTPLQASMPPLNNLPLTKTPLILIAEDNDVSREAMLDFFDFKGFKNVSARNGYEAIALATDNQPDLILMDIQMPRMDGLEAIRQLRAQSFSAPIIALTGLAMLGDEEKCLEAGASSYISKPISLEKLSQIITDYLN